MEQLNFSNSNIDLACEEVGIFLTSVGVEKREALRIRLTLEEILLDVMGVVLAVDAIIDFPATACNVSGWQLTMIHVADTLNMLDEEALHKNK